MREALRGRGKTRREAEEVVRERGRTAPGGVIQLLLAVRDELLRDDPPPRGLPGRADALLLGIAASLQENDPAESADVDTAAVLRDAQDLLERFVETAPDALLTLRASGRVGIWSGAGVELSGRTPRDLQEHGARTLFKDPALFDALVSDLEAGREVAPLEALLLHANGEEVPVRVLAAPIAAPADTTRDQDRYLLFLHDLSEVHGIRLRLIETEKLSAMAKIVGSVAHEFRNPLNSLFLSADLLEDELSGRGAAGEAIAPTLAAIREEIERLNQIINHYLALSKVDSAAPEILDLGETTRAFAEEWKERAAEQGVGLRVRVHEGDLAVSVDPNQVRRILVNLVENAFDALRDATDEDERPRAAAVTLTVRPMRRTVKLTVKDNGPGIHPDLRERVFEPFFTSRSRGSGLGLYLVREIVLAHGGAISLAGNGSPGTTVVIHWPRAEAAKG